MCGVNMEERDKRNLPLSIQVLVDKTYRPWQTAKGTRKKQNDIEINMYKTNNAPATHYYLLLLIIISSLAAYRLIFVFTDFSFRSTSGVGKSNCSAILASSRIVKLNCLACESKAQPMSREGQREGESEREHETMASKIN